jgi:hypothetical protein
MQHEELKVGAKVMVSTTDGDEEDEVTRVLAVDGAVWIVETLRNGRVVVMRGRSDGHQLPNAD